MNNIRKWDSNIDNFPKAISIEGIHDDYEGFRIIIRGYNPDRVFKLLFDNYLGYRNFDESYRLKSIPQFPDNGKNWCLFISNDSEFIDWVVLESNGFLQKGNILHFFIVTTNDIVDILTFDEPICEEL